MINVFVDTNIFVRIATQGRPGCEQQHFEDLRTLVEERAFRLLVPEVVSLEVEKAFRSLPKSLESACNKLSDAVGKATLDSWSEIDSLKVEVLNRIKHFKQSRIAECVEVSASILGFLQSDAITRILLTPDILVAAKRRHIAGKMPDCRKSSDQDALIVESLASFFRNNDAPLASLLFCTENTSDFAVEVKAHDLQRQFALDPRIQASLPTARFSTDLASMLALAKGFEELPPVTNAEIEHAAQMHGLHDDVDDEAFGVFYQLLEDAVYKESARQFEEKFLPSVPYDIQALRSRLSEEIKEIFAACRNCVSWDERSESKLPQWIEYVAEPMTDYTSLSKLVRIRNSLRRYLEVHQQNDRDGIVAEEHRPRI